MSQPASTLLLFRAGGRLCALPVAHAIEAMRPLAVEPLAAPGGLPGFVAGAAVVRGEPVPVIDLAALLGEPGAVATRWLICRAGTAGGAERRVALALTELIGLRAIAEVPDLPPLLRACAADAIDALGAIDAELLVVLRAARCVPEPAWAALGSPAA